MARVVKSDPELQAADHLLYEVQMFRATALGLASGLFPGGPLHDAALDAESAEVLGNIRELL